MKILITLLLFAPASLLSQSHFEQTKAWQDEMNHDYSDSASSPLKEEDRILFKGHDFFEIDSTYSVLATLELTPESKPFEMATSSGRKAIYQKYAIAHFSLNGDSLSLSLYISHRLMKRPGFEDYLFLPFYDLTNGNESYGGGRYIELSKPKEGNKLILDFNQCFNPYCAYNDRYTCPIPPIENRLNVAIKAGIRAPQDLAKPEH